MGGERAGGSQLVAHVVPDGEPVPSETLRAALAERLPPGFVPTAIVNISEIPMTPNGKIDQAALPRPEAAAGTSDHVAPRDDVERRLAAIWEEILELESVGPHDDFFQLGGHSLLAIRVFARIEQTFGKRLPLATLFRTPTLAALADEVRADAPEDDAPWPLVTPIQQGTGGPALFVAPDIRGDVLIGYRRLAGHLGADRPVYALRSRGLEGRSEPRTSIEDIAAEFADEIRRIQPSGPYYLAGHCFGGNVAVEISRRLSGAGERTPLLALIDSTPYGHRRSRRRLVYLGKHIEAARRGAVDVEYLRTRMQNARHRFARQLWWKGGERLYRIAGRLPRTVAADVTEANVRAAGKYVAPRFAGRVMLFFIDRGPEDARDRLRWSELASDGADVHTIAHAGVDHLSVMRQPYIASIAIAIKERMQQIEAADREARE
jgi:thioesterase domain-containing protein/acyl carrier protein